MKIIQINVLAKEKSTGRTTNELHNYLINHGHDSYVAYAIGDKIDDIHMYKMTTFVDYYLHNICARIFGSQGFHSIFATLKLIKWIDNINPDIVHLRNLHSNFINIKILFNYLSTKSIPIIITTHDFWFFTGHCPYPLPDCDNYSCKHCEKFFHKPTIFYNSRRIYLKKQTLLKKNANIIGIQSNSYFSKNVSSGFFSCAKENRVIYNWIDFNSFYPDYDKECFSFANKPIVLAVWSLLDEKQDRFQFFINIANRMHNNYNFVMVGDHNFNVKKYSKVKILSGTSDVNKLRRYYSSADVLFNPSTTDTFGKVVAEALSCGTPAVVFANQALPEIIGNNECGVAVEPFSIESSIEAIEYVVGKGKKTYLEKCVSRSREMFSLESNCQMLVEFYDAMKKNV